MKSRGRRGARLAERVDELRERQLARGEGRRLDLDLDLAHLAADRHDLRHSRNGEESAAHGDLAEAAERARVGSVRARCEGEKGDLAHDRGDRPELRAGDAGRQLGGRDPFGHDLARAVDVLAPGELDPDHGDAGGGDRPHAPDAGGAVHRRFERQRDEQLDLLGGPAGRFREDGDGRGREVGEDVDRQSRNEHEAGHDENEEERGDGARSARARVGSVAGAWSSRPLSGRGLRRRPKRRGRSGAPRRRRGSRCVRRTRAR